MGARVIGIGQPAAGDDAVGIAVLRRLRETGVPGHTDLAEAPEPAALIWLVDRVDPVVLVDAVLGGPPGRIVQLTPERLPALRATVLSSHGIGVAEAVALARTLAPETVARRILIVGVTIARPRAYASGLSRQVRAAVPRAAAEVLRLIGG